MATPFIGEIILFAGNFAPRGYAFCNGQLLSISQNTALFSILGTTYGGNGQTTFGLPDLRGRVPIHAGQSTGPGLSAYNLGQISGSETVTLTAAQLPAHTHPLNASTAAATATDPTGIALGQPARPEYVNATPAAAMNAASVGVNTGGGSPHSNLQPYLAINFIIALEGIYPSRN